MSKLLSRDMDILSILISEYVGTATPVASSSIAGRGGLGLSSATIRNTLAKLEELGLLTHPHTSSGRVPTNAGFRFYVNTILNQRELSEKEQGVIKKQFKDSSRSVEDVLKRTGRILSLISNYTGLVVMPKSEHKTFKQMEFLPLGPSKILGIFVSQEGMVFNRVIDVGQDMTYPDLEKISNFCNNTYYGYSLEDAIQKASKELEEERARFDRLIGRALLWSKELFDEASKDELVVHGEMKFLNTPEFADIKKLTQVMKALEEKKEIVHLLSRVTESEEVCVFIGAESHYEAVSNCSIVTTTYKKRGKVVGTLGVIGPTRMDYSRVIPTVDFTAKLVSSMLEE